MNELMITEIINTIQGESSFVGYPCTLIRLWGCPLRCVWCDTKYSYEEPGIKMSIDAILAKVEHFANPFVEITGGEPLIQKNVYLLINKLLQHKYTVLLETSGGESIKDVPSSVHIIMDIKCPDSKMSHKNLWSNIEYLKSTDEVKFVIASKNDFDWALKIIKQYNLENKCNILMSPVWGSIELKELANWLIAAKLKNTRLNFQLHKYIWGPDTKGV